MYFILRRYYNFLIGTMYEADAMQEIAIAKYIAERDNLSFRDHANLVHKRLHRLCYDAGFNRRFGKELSLNEQVIALKEKRPFGITYEERLVNMMIAFYEHNTARQTCAFFGVPYSQKINKLLNQCAPKNMGWGGKRR